MAFSNGMRKLWGEKHRNIEQNGITESKGGDSEKKDAGYNKS